MTEPSGRCRYEWPMETRQHLCARLTHLVGACVCSCGATHLRKTLGVFKTGEQS